MEPGLAAAAYTAETALEATAGAAIAIAQPTLPLKARWTPINLSLDLKSSAPSLSLTNPQTAYLFFASNSASDATASTHLISLPGPAGAAPDIQSIPTRPAQAGGPLPPSRTGHTSVAIGSFVYIYGGRRASDEEAGAEVLDEAGKVWAFDTKLKVWSLLEPITTVGGVQSPVPSARTGHASVASEVPRPQAMTQGNVCPEVERDEKLRGEGRSGEDVAAAVDASVEMFGTVFVHAGIDAQGERLSDFWAFDVASRTWKRLPDAPGRGRDGTTMALAGDRVYRFGGFDGQEALGGGLEYLELAKETVDDKSGKAEVGIASKKGEKGEWKTVGFKEVEVKDTGKESKGDGIETTKVVIGPKARYGAAMHKVTTGQGRNYLVLLLGQKSSANAAPEYFNDIWAYQLRAGAKTGASIKDTVRGLVGMKQYEGTWAKVELAEASMEEGIHERGPGGRAWFASDVNEEEGKIVLWGEGDGWVLEIE